MKLKLGDEIKVLQGKDKGRRGKIERVLNKKNQILVAGINIFKKNVKKEGNRPGGITEIIKPLSAARVALICPKCNLPTRPIFILQSGKKLRICKKCKQQI